MWRAHPGCRNQGDTRQPTARVLPPGLALCTAVTAMVALQQVEAFELAPFHVLHGQHSANSLLQSHHSALLPVNGGCCGMIRLHCRHRVPEPWRSVLTALRISAKRLQNLQELCCYARSLAK